MKNPALPDRDRWTGWVSFAKLLAVLAMVAAVLIIVSAGFVEVTRRNSFGNFATVKQPNILIWSIALGQAAGALMLAALCSIVNSIYQNSCDQLAVLMLSSGNKADINPQKQEKEEAGPRVVNIADTSPLFNKVCVGWLLIEINGQTIKASKDVKKALRPGGNSFNFLKPDGEQVSLIITIPSDLHLHLTLSR